MLLNKINFNNVERNLYNKKDIDLRWHTFETTDKRKVLYSIREDGFVISTNKKSLNEKIVKPTLSNGVLVVRINRVVYKVKNLVAQCFSDNYFENCCVLLKDKNPYNCNINNLIICDKRTSGKLTGGLAKVKKYIKTKTKIYESVKQFCKDNYIGLRTYYDYKQKRYNTSIVKDILKNETIRR